MSKSIKILLMLLLTTVLMVACSPEKSVDKVDKDKNNDVEKEFVPESIPPGSLGKDDYDYSKVVTPDKAKFYQENQIFAGEETEQKEDKYLVYFYSPECIYCDQFYETLVEYESLDNSYKMYKVNLDMKENVEVWQKFKIQGTPTLMLFNTVDKKIEESVVGLSELSSIPVK